MGDSHARDPMRIGPPIARLRTAQARRPGYLMTLNVVKLERAAVPSALPTMRYVPGASLASLSRPEKRKSLSPLIPRIWIPRSWNFA